MSEAGLALVVLCGWLLREWYLAGRRAAFRSFHQMSEEVLGAGSAADILSKINLALPRISDGLTASLYIYNRGLKVLELVIDGRESLPSSIRPDFPVGGLASGVSLCFSNRTLLNVPDPRRSPFFNEHEKKHLPRSIVFVPMFAQLELVGVMQVTDSLKSYSFRLEDQAALQHLANQAGAAVQLQERREVRERLFQTEKFAAAGQLLSGIAGELRSPIGSILELTGALLTRGGDREFERLEAEALRASEIVSRLAAFGKTERTEAQAVDVQALLTRLLRAPALARLPGGAPKAQFVTFRAMVMGSQDQLEQVFLNIITYAGKANSDEAPISVSSSLLAHRILIEITYKSSRAADLRAPDPFENGSSKGDLFRLGLCRGLIQSHGGDLRFVHDTLTDCRLEIELPVLENQPLRLGTTSAGVPVSRRQLTALMVEPDLKTQRQILEILTRRGDRVVPIGSGEEAADLVLRLRFDVVLCSARLPGLNWVEFFERVRPNVGSFILLTHGHDQELSKAFQNGEGFVLTKPLDERMLNRICDAIAERSNGSSPS